MNEWNIQSRAHACQACEKAFTDKVHFYTLLQAGKNELQRLDICKSCWESTYAEGIVDRKGFISHWHGTYQAPPAGPVEAIQKDTAETLLRRLIEANDPKHRPACYILAAMLERKRLLKVKEQFKREGTRICVYEHPKTGDLFTISDPDLQLNQLEEVQRDVADLLLNGYNPQPAAAPVAVEPDAPAESGVSNVPETEATLEPVSAEVTESLEIPAENMSVTSRPDGDPSHIGLGANEGDAAQSVRPPQP